MLLISFGDIPMYFVYILRSKTTDHFYIGQTSNLNFRIRRHNENTVTATKNKGPWELVYAESFDTRSQAMKREKYLKSLKSRKAIQKIMAECKTGKQC